MKTLERKPIKFSSQYDLWKKIQKQIMPHKTPMKIQQILSQIDHQVEGLGL